MKQSTRNVVGFAVLVVLLAVLFYWNINTGSVHLSMERIFTLLRWGNDGSMEGNILWKIRLSRLLGAALLGGHCPSQASYSRPSSKTRLQAPLCWGSHPAPACL